MKRQHRAQNDEFPSGGGEMGQRIRSFDWGKTPIGPIQSWSPALRMIVRFMLANPYPALLWWGPEYISIYNDAYRPILGTKHPWGLGQPVRECWKEIWHILQPLIDRPFKGGPATWNDDILLEINRHGFLEEGHFTIGYSPVPDDSAPGGIGGVLATVQEITAKVVGERRIAALRDLGTCCLNSKTPEQACLAATKTLAQYEKDLPFVLLYLIDADGKNARLAGAAGVKEGSEICPLTIAIDHLAQHPWPINQVIDSDSPQVVEHLGKRVAVPPGPWSDPPDSALVAPIASIKPHEPAAVMIAGLSARLKFDDFYRDFIGFIANQISTAIANARAYDEERKRAEALAEIDRAKTAFFSNVSHEFRTPLTLMLGPIKDALADPAASPLVKQRLDVAQRNSLRLLKLVNSLLDFARIEAGRMQASYEPTELNVLTAEIASVFRSAVERAGMKFTVQCDALRQPAFVDRDMWEKVVLNLLSNAFKYTLKGEISVSLKQKADGAELSVRDTGVGIPQQELPLLFQRFHRVEGVHGRTHEGTGIGLALVQELLKLHGGSIRVESTLGAGSNFIVTLPLGSRHLPPERIRTPRMLSSTALDSGTYVDEALRWLPETSTGDKSLDSEMPGELHTNSAHFSLTRGARIILAEDNSDMRGYVLRLLKPYWNVEAVVDGQAALDSALKNKPDLILSDVMMPRLDGFGLVKALRFDDKLKSVPIILLSARAGEEARVEGMESGADDYLVKPFSARELLARVSGALALSRVRRDSADALHANEERFRAFVTASADVVYSMSPDWREMRYLQGQEFIADTSQPTRSWLQKYVPLQDQPRVLESINRAIQTKSVFEVEHRIRRVDGTLGWALSRAIPILDSNAQIIEWLGAASDITDRRRAAESIRRHGEQFATLFNQAPLGVYLVDSDFRIREVNPIALPVFGDIPNIIGSDFENVIHRLWEKDYADEILRIFRKTLETGESYVTSERTETRRDRGVKEYYEWRVDRITLADGRYGLVCYFRDIAQEIQARAEREHLLDAERSARRDAETANRLKDEFLANLSHELRTPLNAILGWSQIMEHNEADRETVAEGVKVISRNARVQIQLIEDLLDLSRIISGKLRLNVKAVNVADVVLAAIESVAPSAAAKGLRIEKVLDFHAGPVSGDASRLQQVVWNLLSNSVKFTPKGGKIQITVGRVKSHVDVAVSDTGQGIKPEFLPFIFERFRQADPSTTRQFGGLGIGLSLVKHLVELHGGSVSAKSAGEGQGATFTVTLPVSMARRTQYPQTSDLESPHHLPLGHEVNLDGVRVLFVDDDPDARSMGKRILSESKADVILAASAVEALELLRSHRPHVLVSDIGMPEADGYELIHRVRELPLNQGGETPAAALTAYARSEDRQRALLAGYQSHVSKPVEPQELITVVASLAGKVRRNRPEGPR